MIELDIRLPLARFQLEVRQKSDARIIALLGTSGAGKTSLLEAIAGVRSHVAGRVAVDGEAFLDTARRLRLPPERRRIGYVPQDAMLFPHLDVRGNLRFGAIPDERRFDEAVEILDLGPLLARSPYALSGGERQRVALGRALVTAPRLLLLDEPLAAVDVDLRERIVPYLLRVREVTEAKILYVTHNFGEALALADEAMVLREGRLAASGAPRDVLRLGNLALLDAQIRFENVLHGSIRSSDEATGVAVLVPSAGVALVVPGAPDLRPGSRATYGLPAEDILVSVHPLTGVSARNVIEARVTAIEPLAHDALVNLDASGLALRAKLTHAAVTELGLLPGRAAWLAIKTHSLRRLG